MLVMNLPRAQKSARKYIPPEPLLVNMGRSNAVHYCADLQVSEYFVRECVQQSNLPTLDVCLWTW